MTIVAVFGSANPLPGSEGYAQAETLGTLLAEKDYTVMTGGYCGTMEAVSKGAAEAGAITIGVTCQDIDRYRPGGANPWVQTAIPTENLNRRLEILTREPDAFIALPGGLGTLCEITLALNLMAVNSISPKPLILIGPAWKQSWRTIIEANSELISQLHADLISYVENASDAVQLLNHLLEK